MATKRSDAEILKDLLGVECRLSPENLACDGERPKAEQRRVYRVLMVQKVELIKELGRTPSDREVWDI